MCCFRLHFSDFNALFFEKIKNLLQFNFEKNNLLCKKREKNNLSRGKIPKICNCFPKQKKCVFAFLMKCYEKFICDCLHKQRIYFGVFLKQKQIFGFVSESKCIFSFVSASKNIFTCRYKD